MKICSIVYTGCLRLPSVTKSCLLYTSGKMLFHKKGGASAQEAKPKKERVRWADRRGVPEEGLERFQEYLHTYSTNKNHPVKILCSFYKGTQ